MHALGNDFLQLRKGKERYRVIDPREFLARQAKKPRSKAAPVKGILKPPRAVFDPPLPDQEGKRSEELDSIINRAVAQAMESMNPTQPSDPPSVLRKSKEEAEAEQAAKDRAKFEQRFCGRPVIAGSAGASFTIPSIAQAYKRGYARSRRIGRHPHSSANSTK